MEVALSPILIFAYNRPGHTARLVESLVNCELSGQSELFVFIDAPKKDAAGDVIQKHKEVVEFFNTLTHFKKITIYQGEINKGVDQSILDGVSKIISIYGKVIVLEDDLVVSSFFLKYMNWALNYYENDKRMYSVNGFMFPVKTDNSSVILLPFSCAWGWATWSDRWKPFNFDDKNRAVISQSPALKNLFNLPGVDYANMLIDNKECWDINWYFYVFKNNGLNVFPAKTLVKNTGFDGTGVHCPDKEFIQDFDFQTKVTLNPPVEIDVSFLKSYYDHFEKLNAEESKPLTSLFKKIIYKLAK